MLSLPHLIHTQRPMQGQFESVDSFGEAINVFNLTTISPLEETATKVSAETIETLLGALDNAGNILENAQVSTLDAQGFTTQPVPNMEEIDDSDFGFTVLPPLPPSGPDTAQIGGIGSGTTDSWLGSGFGSENSDAGIIDPDDQEMIQK